MPFGYTDGTYKVVDEITGKEFFSDEMAEDWDGSIRHQDNLDGKHPDYEIRRLPPEEFPEIISEIQVDVYVTADVVFYAGTDVPRLQE